MQRDQRKRRVVARDEHIDCRVIDRLEHRLDAQIAEAVVKRRRQIEQHEGDAVDEAARQVPDAVARVVDEHARQSRRRQSRTDAVRHGVEHFFKRQRRFFYCQFLHRKTSLQREELSPSLL